MEMGPHWGKRAGPVCAPLPAAASVHRSPFVFPVAPAACPVNLQASALPATLSLLLSWASRLFSASRSLSCEHPRPEGSGEPPTGQNPGCFPCWVGDGEAQAHPQTSTCAAGALGKSPVPRA